MQGVWSGLVALLFLTLLPATAEAQACLGNGASPSEGFTSAGASFTDGAWGLSAATGANLLGPMAFQLGGSHTFVDNSDVGISSVGTTVAADVTTDSRWSVCPGAGVSYQWLSNDAGTEVDADGVILGGGLGFGVEFETGRSTRFLPKVDATVVHNRATISGRTASETYGSFSATLIIAGKSVYGGPSASITTLDNSDPVFSVGFGFIY